MSGKLTRRTSQDPLRDTQRVIKAIKDSAEQLPSDERRAFLRKALTAGAATFVGGAFAGLSNKANAFVDKAQRPDLMKAPYPPGIPPWTRTLGPGVTAAPYGKPSQYEKDVIRRDVSWLAPTTQSSVNFTPLQSMHSIITPNGLHFERDHAGHPNINPAEHRLLIHGMVDRPMLFSMDDLMRYPSIQKTYFIECAANGAMEWHRAQLNSLQYTHGMISTAMWTGVPLSTLLGDTGVKKGAKWLLIEGADGAAMTRSLPLDKALDDCLIAWGQNGEMCRPENGYPLRIVVPGWEGNINVKWLRRIKVGDKPWWTREETSEYSDMLPDGKARAFTFFEGVKSVVNFPCPEMPPKFGKGRYEVTGFAWSGNGKIKHVDVSFDGGKNWRRAELQDPVLDKCMTRFVIPWEWDGGPALVGSRAVDSTGTVQPTIGQLRAARGAKSVYHNNSIQFWQVTPDGKVNNVQLDY